MNQVSEMLKSEFGKVKALLCELRKGNHEEQPTVLEVKTPAMKNSCEALDSREVSVSTKKNRSIVFDVPDRNEWFTGRQKELESLERCLSLEKRDHKLRKAAICGLGGCGKTTLAAQFAWKHESEYEGGVFWFSMEDERKFESCVNDIALRLELMKNSPDLTLTQILTFISQREKRWLMVLDNVDQPELSRKMQKCLIGTWLRQSNGHMLITTRRERKEICQCVKLKLNCCVEIFSFSIDEAKEFLLSRFSGENAAGQEDALNELVVELGCLPLALEQAGAHISSLHCPVNKYLEQYKLERIQLLSERHAIPSREYDSLNRLSVHTTWLLNFEYVRKSKYGEIATRFVQAAAFLDPDEIHEGLINAELLLATDVVAEKKRELPLTNNQIVEVLTKFSLFQRKSVGCMRLHRLVQQVIRGTMTSQEVDKAMYTTFQLLKKAAQSPGESATDRIVFSIFRHWLALRRHITQQVSARPNDSSAERLAKLINSGSREILFEVTRNLKGSTQTIENRRGLSALLDFDYDRCPVRQVLEYEKRRRCSSTTQRSRPIPLKVPSGSPTGSPPGSSLDWPLISSLQYHLRSPPRSPSGSLSGSLSGSPTGSPQGSFCDLHTAVPSKLRSVGPFRFPPGLSLDLHRKSSLGRSLESPFRSPSGSLSGSLSGSPTGSPQGSSYELSSVFPSRSCSGGSSGLPPGSSLDWHSRSSPGWLPQSPSRSPSGVPLGPHQGSSLEWHPKAPSGAPLGVTSGSPPGSSSEWPSRLSSEWLLGSHSTSPFRLLSGAPSRLPSGVPSGAPSGVPSGAPSGSRPGSFSEWPLRSSLIWPPVWPSTWLSRLPSGAPSGLPSGLPSGALSGSPSGVPSGLPSGSPLVVPSGVPSGAPSGAPTRPPPGSFSQWPLGWREEVD